jgi:hypothetical protein
MSLINPFATAQARTRTIIAAPLACSAAPIRLLSSRSLPDSGGSSPRRLRQLSLGPEAPTASHWAGVHSHRLRQRRPQWLSSGNVLGRREWTQAFAQPSTATSPTPPSGGSSPHHATIAESRPAQGTINTHAGEVRAGSATPSTGQCRGLYRGVLNQTLAAHSTSVPSYFARICSDHP